MQQYLREQIDSFKSNFESISAVVSMLIENVNMQLEAESRDLTDRKMISLYGAL